jgi:hypothetical protein
MESAKWLAIEGCAVLFVLLLQTAYSVACWRVLEKAGKPGWGIFIPIYNYILFLQASGKPAWWVIFFIIPCLNVAAPIMLILMAIGLAKNFGHGTGYAMGLIFLWPIFLPLLAFGSSLYTEPEPA